MDHGSGTYRRFLAGDETALTTLLQTYREGLVLYVNGIVHNVYDAEDVVQEVFVTLFVKRPLFHGDDGFKTWLYAVARNKAVDLLRKQKRGSAVPLDEAPAAETARVEDVYAAADRRRTVLRLLDSLKPEYKEVLFLTYFEGLSNKQAAKVMRKSVHAVETLNSRARAALRQRMEKEGLTYENV